MNIKMFPSGSLYDECKQQKLSVRKYPQYTLALCKRPYLSPYHKKDLWVNACRGLVFNYETNEIVMIPPMKSRDVLTQTKFLNRVSDSEELIDGMMINLFWFQDQWFLSTRSLIIPVVEFESLTYPWVPKLKDSLETVPFDQLQSNQTYSFVMRHTSSRLTSIVETNEMVLVEVYEGLSRVTPLPVLSGVRTPKKTKSILGIQKGLTGIKDGIRYKWLTPEHKFIQMIVPNKEDPLLQYLGLRNSGYLTPYLELFPEKRFEYDNYRTRVQQLIQLIYQYYVSVYIQKQVTMEDVPFSLKPVLYTIHRHYLQTKLAISQKYVKQYVYQLSPEKILFILNNRFN